MYEKGFSSIVVILIVLVISGGFIGAFYFIKNSKLLDDTFSSETSFPVQNKIKSNKSQNDYGKNRVPLESSKAVTPYQIDCNYGIKTKTVMRGDQEYQSNTYEQQVAPNGSKMRVGSLIVKFKDGISLTKQNEIHQNAGAIPCDKSGLPNTFRIQTSKEGLEDAIKVYKSFKEVEYVEPDYIVSAGI